MNILPSFLSFFAFLSVFQAQAAEFPESDWSSVDANTAGLDPIRLQSLADYTFASDNPQKNTDALLIVRGGKVVYERYQFGYGPQMRHLSWSIAKSFSSVLLGIAESDGILSRTSKMSAFFPATYSRTDTDQRDSVDVLSLLSMSSGIDWNEDYSAKAPLKSDVTQMLYMNARRDNAAYVASRPMAHGAGELYHYSTGDTTLALGMLKQQLADEEYASYPWRRLFDRIGMKNVVWERDGSGTFDGGTYIYATARDFARFGYLLLNQGRWKDDTVISPSWMKLIRTLSPGLTNGTVKPDGFATYGTGFWLNTPAPKWGMKTPFPDAPADTFFALGHDGQVIVIIPSLDIVAVRLAHDQTDNVLDWNQFFDLLARSVVTSNPGQVALSGTENETVAAIPPQKVNVPAYGSEVKHTSAIYFPKLLASVRAKDFCSCHFVVGQSENLCSEIVRNGFPIIHMSIDEEKQTAQFGIIAAQKARMTSERFGCSFE